MTDTFTNTKGKFCSLRFLQIQPVHPSQDGSLGKIAAVVIGLSCGVHVTFFKTQNCTRKIGENFCLKYVSKTRLLKESMQFLQTLLGIELFKGWTPFQLLYLQEKVFESIMQAGGDLNGP